MKILSVHAVAPFAPILNLACLKTRGEPPTVTLDCTGGNPVRQSVSNRMLTKMLLVFLGSGIGGLCRWGVFLASDRWLGKGFPVGTLLVNITGCLAVGFLAAFFAESDATREHWRLSIIVGFLGGFTTFSAFGKETFLLSSGGHQAAALANILLSVGLGLLAVWVGTRIGTRLMPG